MNYLLLTMSPKYRCGTDIHLFQPLFANKVAVFSALIPFFPDISHH